MRWVGDVPVGHYLRRAQRDDFEPLYALCCVEPVYRYLADGHVPPRAILERWFDDDELWVLCDDEDVLVGCVRLSALPDPAHVELTYLLHPDHWGRGLATRMSATVIEQVFTRPSITRIVATADGPNGRSIAVMQRLGMRYAQMIDHPMGPGPEYHLARDDYRPDDVLLPVRV